MCVLTLQYFARQLLCDQCTKRLRQLPRISLQDRVSHSSQQEIQGCIRRANSTVCLLRYVSIFSKAYIFMKLPARLASARESKDAALVVEKYKRGS